MNLFEKVFGAKHSFGTNLVITLENRPSDFLGLNTICNSEQALETRNILVIGVWAFVIIWLIGMLLIGGDLFFAMVLFFVAIIISVLATELPGKAPVTEKSEVNQIPS